MEHDKVAATHGQHKKSGAKGDKADNKEKKKKQKKVSRASVKIISRQENVAKLEQFDSVKQLLEEACAAVAVAFGEHYDVTEKTIRMLEILKDRDHSMRWENKLPDDDLEQERMAVYKILRQYRYLRDVPQFDF